MKEDLIVQIMKDMCGESYGYEGENNRNLKRYAENLVNTNYRKIPDGSVVLNKEEREEEISRWKDIIIREIKRARKETAREIFEKIHNREGYYPLASVGTSQNDMIVIAKEYGIKYTPNGVEVEE